MGLNDNEDDFLQNFIVGGTRPVFLADRSAEEKQANAEFIREKTFKMKLWRWVQGCSVGFFLCGVILISVYFKFLT